METPESLDRYDRKLRQATSDGTGSGGEFGNNFEALMDGGDSIALGTRIRDALSFLRPEIHLRKPRQVEGVVVNISRPSLKRMPEQG